MIGEPPGDGSGEGTGAPTINLEELGGSSEFGSDSSRCSSGSDELAALNEEAGMPLEALRERYHIETATVNAHFSVSQILSPTATTSTASLLSTTGPVILPGVVYNDSTRGNHLSSTHTPRLSPSPTLLFQQDELSNASSNSSLSGRHHNPSGNLNSSGSSRTGSQSRPNSTSLNTIYTRSSSIAEQSNNDSDPEYVPVLKKRKQYSIRIGDNFQAEVPCDRAHSQFTNTSQCNTSLPSTSATFEHPAYRGTITPSNGSAFKPVHHKYHNPDKQFPSATITRVPLSSVTPKKSSTDFLNRPKSQIDRYAIEERCQWKPKDILDDGILGCFMSSANAKWKGDGKPVPDGGKVPDSEVLLQRLYANDYDVNKTLNSIQKYDPLKAGSNAFQYFISVKKWDKSDIDMFETGIKNFGKDFTKIRNELLKNKTTTEVVDFYYHWKISDRKMNFVNKVSLTNSAWKKIGIDATNDVDFMKHLMMEQQTKNDTKYDTLENIGYIEMQSSSGSSTAKSGQPKIDKSKVPFLTKSTKTRKARKR